MVKKKPNDFYFYYYDFYSSALQIVRWASLFDPRSCNATLDWQHCAVHTITITTTYHYCSTFGFGLLGQRSLPVKLAPTLHYTSQVESETEHRAGI